MSKRPSEAAENARPLAAATAPSAPAIAWPRPLYSRTQVNAAGDALIGRSSAPDQVRRALADTRVFVDQLKRAIE